MKFKSQLENIIFPENRELYYKASGLMGSGELCLSYGKLNTSDYVVHIKVTAGLPMLPKFHFEGLARWEKNGQIYDFVSYEEKDFGKKIHKKYEMSAEGLNYIENKKGLVVEREVQYFSTPDGLDKLFDPMSAAALFPLELNENESKSLFIFGKQRIISVEICKTNSVIRVQKMTGINATWESALSQTSMHTNSRGLIDSIEFSLPMGVGKIKVKTEKEESIDSKTISLKIDGFHKEF